MPQQQQASAPSSWMAQGAFAKASNPPAKPVEAVQDATGASALVSKGLLALATLLTVYVGVVILNGLRGMLQGAYYSAAKNAGPQSMIASILGFLLNVLGVGFRQSEGAGAAAGGAVAKGAPSASDAKQAAGDAAQKAKSALPGMGNRDSNVREVLSRRTQAVQHHFPGSLSADDFLARVEAALAQEGFRGDNTLALTNVCRDESTGILKGKIDEIFGHCFNINGLGGVLTCGKSGLAAGLSHAPVCDNGRERYAFFAFPHIAVDEKGEPGTIFRPGREGQSSACGAMLFAAGAVKEQGLHADDVGIHDHREPEGSILLNRLKRQLKSMGRDPADVDVVELTKIAGHVITRDLKQLIDQAVDTSKADYTVVTGVQIHSWPNPESGEPVLEYVQPVSAYSVINGESKEIALSLMPAPSPRQVTMFARGTGGEKIMVPDAMGYVQGTTLVGIEQPTTVSA